MEVWSSTRSVVVAASAMVSIESWASSPQATMSKPSCSARLAASGTCLGQPPTPVTKRMGGPYRKAGRLQSGLWRTGPQQRTTDVAG